MSGESIFIQAIGLFGTVLFFLSYQCRNNRTLFHAGILDEIVTEVSMIVSIFRYGWENLDSVSGQD